MSRTQENVLLVFALIAFFGPNGWFVWTAVTRPSLLDEALKNPVALVFIAEAFVLMFLFAYLIARQGVRSPGWIGFILMSLAGGMMFSIPACLYLWSRQARNHRPT